MCCQCSILRAPHLMSLNMNSTPTIRRCAVTVVSYMKPFTNGIVQFSAAQASAAVQTQRHIAAKAGAQPYLVFFPTNASARQSGSVVWNGGGDAPDNPIWMISGEDGVNYVLGNDGKVYAQKDLPISG